MSYEKWEKRRSGEDANLQSHLQNYFNLLRLYEISLKILVLLKIMLVPVSRRRTESRVPNFPISSQHSNVEYIMYHARGFVHVQEAEQHWKWY